MKTFINTKKNNSSLENLVEVFNNEDCDPEEDCVCDSPKLDVRYYGWSMLADGEEDGDSQNNSTNEILQIEP